MNAYGYIRLAAGAAFLALAIALGRPLLLMPAGFLLISTPLDPLCKPGAFARQGARR